MVQALERAIQNAQGTPENSTKVSMGAQNDFAPVVTWKAGCPPHPKKTLTRSKEAISDPPLKKGQSTYAYFRCTRFQPTARAIKTVREFVTGNDILRIVAHRCIIEDA
jgi:hypothetical protein